MGLRLLMLVFAASLFFSGCNDYSDLPEPVAFYYRTRLRHPDTFELLQYDLIRDIQEKEVLYAAKEESVFYLFPTEKLSERISKIEKSEKILATAYRIRYKAMNDFGVMMDGNGVVLFDDHGMLLDVNDDTTLMTSIRFLFKEKYRKGFISRLDKELLKKDAKKFFIDTSDYLKPSF